MSRTKCLRHLDGHAQGKCLRSDDGVVGISTISVEGNSHGLNVLLWMSTGRIRYAVIESV